MNEQVETWNQPGYILGEQPKALWATGSTPNANNFIAKADANIFEIRGGAEGPTEVIKINPSGRLFWHGREVETDDDFRAAMLELAEYLSGKKR